MTRNFKQRATRNLQAALAPNRRFPHNPFQGRWLRFYFFNPDLLFEPQFVMKAKALRNGENSVCVCMSDLDFAPLEDDAIQNEIFLDEAMSGEDYMATLRGTSAADGWLYRMDRYGWASDVGQWCIYCERNNEIAVLALRGDVVARDFVPVLQQFGALPIGQAIKEPRSYGLSSRGLPDEWRDIMLQEYGVKENGDP